METTTKPNPVDMPPITSLDELYSIVTALERNTISVWERLAGEMKTYRNGATGKVFQDLINQGIAQVNLIDELAKTTGAKINIAVDDIWSDQDLLGDLAQEIADNPYLLTPYRALRLAVMNKERLFEILSALVANQEDAVICQHAENLARGQLSEIAQLRLRRRRASRSKIKTAINKAGLGTTPNEMAQFDTIVKTVHAIIRTVTLIIRKSFVSQMTDEAEQVLDKLLEDFHDFPGALIEGNDYAVLEAGIKQDNEDLFSALKTLLRELESAVDLFLGYAESSNSGEVVHAAQTKAERYVHRIARIRDELNLTVLK